MKYEFSVLYCPVLSNNGIASWLKVKSGEGWEFVCASLDGSSWSSRERFIFRRPI